MAGQEQTATVDAADIDEAVVEDLGDDLSFDDLDLGESPDLDGADLAGFGDLEATFSDPHVRIPTKLFFGFLRVARAVITTSGRDVASKSVQLSVSGANLVLRATDADTYYEQKIELLNPDNRISGSLCIPVDTIIKVAKVIPAHTVFIRRGEQTFIHLAGGELLLEDYTIPDEHFICASKYEKEGEVDSTELASALRDLSPIASVSPNAAERRILVEGGKAYATYMWAVVSQKLACPDMDIRVRDISNLKVILSNQPSSEIVVERSKEKGKPEMVRLSSSLFSYAFLASDARVSETMKNSVNQVLTGKGVFVDAKQLARLVEIGAALPYSTGKIDLNMGESSLDVIIKTRKGHDNPFSLVGTVNGTTSLPKPLAVQAKLLYIMLKTFGCKASVLVSLTEKGIGVSSDATEAVMYVETES